LRIKVASLGQLPDRKLQRDMEIYARAERYMVSRSPGFPAVWEEAKRSSVEELENEENGQSLPRRVFNALMNRPLKAESVAEDPQSER
jgi:small subunit ribosomal protein S20